MSKEVDVVIVGGGPSGLAGALYTGRANMETVVLERKMLGGQIIESPDVDNYPGFPEGISGPDLTENMREHVEKFDVTLEYERVKDIELDGPYKIVESTEETYRAPIVILASGADPRRLDIPGEKELTGSGVSYCATCDGAFFRDQKVVVVGGGDSATTESVFLTRFASEIKLVHRRQGFRAAPIHVEQAGEQDKIEFILNTVLTEIHGDESVEGVTLRNVESGEESYMECEGVFILIGHEPNTVIFRGQLPMNEAGYIKNEKGCASTRLQGVFVAGDVADPTYRQAVSAAGTGCMAALEVERYLAAKEMS